MLRYIVPIVIFCSLVACKPTTYTPKPQGYFRIDTPEAHKYRLFDKEGYPYTFEYPVYAEVVPDSSYYKGNADNPWWINVNFPSLGGMINITYRKIASQEIFQQMTKDSYRFTFFHHEKADYINDEYFSNPASGISFVLYTVGGNAASRYQFTATDSTKNFMLGSLYFDVTPNADSLKPATDFLHQDIVHMLMTLKFR